MCLCTVRVPLVSNAQKIILKYMVIFFFKTRRDSLCNSDGGGHRGVNAKTPNGT